MVSRSKVVSSRHCGNLSRLRITYLVLLPCKLTGIGNNVFSHFKDIVNKDSECLEPKDIVIWCKAGLCKQTIEVNALKRDE
jgi:hypothetical protein